RELVERRFGGEVVVRDEQVTAPEAVPHLGGEAGGLRRVGGIHHGHELFVANAPDLVGDGVHAVFLRLFGGHGSEGDIGARFGTGDGDGTVFVAAPPDDCDHAHGTPPRTRFAP